MADEDPEKKESPRPPWPLMGPPDPLSQWPLMGLPPADPLPGLMTPPGQDTQYEPWDPGELVALLSELVDLAGACCKLATPFAVAALVWLSYLALGGKPLLP